MVTFLVRLQVIVKEKLVMMSFVEFWNYGDFMMMMDTELISLFAGIISSAMFVSSHVPMLLKAYRTRDLHSYSPLNLVLINVGNLIYWFYIVKLPFGPIWLLHAFYTFSSALLLILYYQLYFSHCLQWYICKIQLKKCLQI